MKTGLSVLRRSLLEKEKNNNKVKRSRAGDLYDVEVP